VFLLKKITQMNEIKRDGDKLSLYIYIIIHYFSYYLITNWSWSPPS